MNVEQGRRVNVRLSAVKAALRRRQGAPTRRSSLAAGVHPVGERGASDKDAAGKDRPALYGHERQARGLRPGCPTRPPPEETRRRAIVTSEGTSKRVSCHVCVWWVLEV